MSESTFRPMHPILALSKARLIEFLRRPEALFWVYFFPLLMVIVLGIAFRNQPVEVLDIDVAKSASSTQIVEALSQDERLRVHSYEKEESRQRLRKGKTSLMITSGKEAFDDIQYHYDPQTPGSAQARNLAEELLQTAAGRTDVIKTENVVFEEQGGRYVDFLVPGLLGMGLMGGGLWGVGFAIVDLRIRKLLKRFMATPMKRSHFLLSMMLSRLVFMIPQVIVLILFSYLIFGFRVYGSWPAVLFIIFLGAFEFAAIGLLVGSRAQTLETASGLMNLVMLPMWTLCGIFFSYERFPEIVQPIIRWLPLTPIIDSLRGVMLDGKSLFEMNYEIMVMSAWLVATFAIAMVIFRWND